MRKITWAFVSLIAIVTMAAGASTASATYTINNPGPITATFPNTGSIRFTTTSPAATLDCPITLRGAVAGTATRLADGLLNIGFVTAGQIIPNPCNGATVTLLFPSPGWLIGLRGTAPNYTLNILNVQVGINLLISCLFRGNVTANYNSTTGAITGISGTLIKQSGICSNATVGGTGGTLSPIITGTP